jgi:glycosyltransferase involved in cell wall biosynthesis
MVINQLVHTLSYGDAISGEVVAICRLLRAKGIKSEIFSINTNEKLKGWTRHYSEFCPGEQTLIHHYSLGSPLNELFIGATKARRITVYHNLTPEIWFEGYNARVLADLKQGREELPKVLASSDSIFADSTYNKEEVVGLGFKNCEVLPLLIDESKWGGIPANPGIAAALRGHGGVNILHVGRTAPNKRLEDILKAFYFYHHKINQKSRLWLVGSDIDTEIYSFELRMLISELRLKEAVTLTGSVAETELRAFYENSDLYLCMSEHEGFCVPLLEAMHFDVPILAYNSCAVPETLGSAGLVFNEKDFPLVAELMNIVLTDEKLRMQLIAAGRDRIGGFNETAFAARLYGLLGL